MLRLFSALLCVALFAVAETWAGDFRIDTRVFVDEERTPVYKNVIIFRHPIVYDYLDASNEITIYDSQARKLILADAARKV